MITAIISLYILGFMASYFLCRSAMWEKHNSNQWLLLEKVIAVNLSLLSWLTVFLFIIIYTLIVNDILDPDKTEKW